MQGKNLFGWAETNVSPLPHHYAGKQFFGWAEQMFHPCLWQLAKIGLVFNQCFPGLVILHVFITDVVGQ